LYISRSFVVCVRNAETFIAVAGLESLGKREERLGELDNADADMANGPAGEMSPMIPMSLPLSS